MLGPKRHTETKQSFFECLCVQKISRGFLTNQHQQPKIKMLAVAFMDILVGSGGIGASASAASSLAHQGSWGAILRTPTYQTNIDHIDKKTT